MLFVMFPHPESVSSRQGGRDYAWVLEAATGPGVPVLDLLPSLGASGVPVDCVLLLPEDYHPSVRGHGLATEEVMKWLVGGPLGATCAGNWSAEG